MEDFGVKVTTYDPWANPSEVKHEYGIESLETLPSDKYEAVVLEVAHKEFLDLDLSNLLSQNGVVYDVKGILPHSKDIEFL